MSFLAAVPAPILGCVLLASAPQITTPPTTPPAPPPAAPTAAPTDSPTPAAAPRTAIISLRTGDLLTGALLSDADPLILQHPILGHLSIPQSDIADIRLVTVPQAQSATKAAQKAAADASAPPPVQDPTSLLYGWKGAASIGLNGAAGNSEGLYFRIGLDLNRLTSASKTTANLKYVYATSSGEKSEENARIDLRHDWLPRGKDHWRPFVQASLEYDHFQDWNLRLSSTAGLGYELVKTDRLLILPRAGLGFSREFGGSDNTTHPESLLGMDIEYTINDRSKLFTSTDVFWRLDETSEYRTLTKAGYEIIIDASTGLSLRLGAENRYDAAARNGSKRNDLTYFALVVWNF